MGSTDNYDNVCDMGSTPRTPALPSKPDRLMAYCDRCQRSFPTNGTLERHKEDSNAHWSCDDCDLDFESTEARRQHYIQSPNHPSCRDCDHHFNSKESRIKHMTAKHWYCQTHDEVIVLLPFQRYVIETDTASHTTCYRHSNLKTASSHTTDRVQIITSVKSAIAISTTRMS